MSSNIKNFSIIAHIDHGKSTLADRMLEATGALIRQRNREQFLDSMELERERGITIKAKAVRMIWKDVVLNLIDTPGHVDFTFEVYRALWACEGVVLLVDASQGVQAQTVANCALARKANLEIIPVINKVDLANANVEETARQIREVLGIVSEPYKISAKLGWGVEELLDGIIRLIPAPKVSSDIAFRGLLFDSFFDSFQGVALLVRVFDAEVNVGDRIRFAHNLSSGAYLVEEAGYLTPSRQSTGKLSCGEVGYLFCGLRDPKVIRHGETVISAQSQEVRPIQPLGAPFKPFVFVGMFPVHIGKVEDLRDALTKLHLTDPSFEYLVESSGALGPGFRCGFLGLLHLEIISERLRREFNLDIIVTNPNVCYRVTTKKNETVDVSNPARFPEHGNILSIEEPFVSVRILTPVEHVGSILELLKSRRGIHKEMRHLTPTLVEIVWEIPLAEMVVDFYDKLKSLSRGYASMDYELCGYLTQEKLVKVEVLIHGEACDALGFVASRDTAYSEARKILERLREVIPRQLFEIILQAASQGKIIAKDKIPPLRKDVLAKCYGGDITRKMKLLSRQKEGKKKMRMLGRVEVPPEAFLTVLKR